MGLAADLGYRHREPNSLHRAVQSLGSTRAGGWVFSRTLRHVDDVVARISRGRQSGPGLLAGLPVLDLTTTGRRSGRRRTSHLIAIPVRADLALLGTNFGRSSTPAWALNLEADPRACVSYRGRTLRVVARPATDTERAEVMERARRVYRGYELYRQRITGRRLRIFILKRSEP